MILDILDNAHRYLTLNTGFAMAFQFLMRPDLKELATDKYEIDSHRVFAIAARDSGRKRSDALLETHEKYVDIQLVLDGTDNMGWRPKSSCQQPTGEYDPETDLQFFADEPDAWLATKRGVFVVFFPEDAHMPLISPDPVHKVVVKVALNRI